MGAGIVAEKRRVCLVSGVADMIKLMSSINPIFNISSASSKTMVEMDDNFTVPRFMWSINRPGVATIICGDLRKRRNWRSIS